MRHFQHAPYAPAESFFTPALNNICITFLRLVETRQSPKRLAQMHAIVVEHFPAFSVENGTLHAFTERLDPQVIKQLGELEQLIEPGFAQLSTYNFLAAGDPVLKRNRMQALSAFPWLAPLLIEYWPETPKFSSLTEVGAHRWDEAHRNRVKQLCQAIDTGRPLIETAAKLLNVPKEIIRWSACKEFVFLEPFSVHQMDTMLRVLSMLPPEKRPTCAIEWRALRTTLESFVRTFRRYIEEGSWADTGKNERERNVAVLATPAMQDILRHRLKEFAKMHIVHKAIAPWFANNFDSVHDFLVVLRNAMKVRCYGYHDPRNALVDGSSAFLLAWLAERDLSDIVAASLKWHDRIHVELNRARSSPKELAVLGGNSLAQWPILLKKPVEFDDLRIVQLRNRAELIEEGKIMHHCVSTYFGRCLDASSQIFSIRTLDDKRLSTLEVHIDSQKGGIATIRSHCGFKNAKPSERCTNAAVAFVDLLQSTDFNNIFDRLIQFRESKWPQDKRTDFDQVVEEVAWRCAFTTEEAAQALLEQLRNVESKSLEPKSSARA